MKSRSLDFLRMIIISPELLWFGLISVSALYFGDYLAFLGNRLTGDEELWKVLFAFPVSFATASFVLARMVLGPMGKEENKCLYDWPGYHRLVDRVNLAIMFTLVGCVVAIAAWIGSDALEKSKVALLYLISIGITGIPVLTLYLAAQKLKELLTRFA